MDFQSIFGEILDKIWISIEQHSISLPTYMYTVYVYALWFTKQVRLALGLTLVLLRGRATCAGVWSTAQSAHHRLPPLLPLRLDFRAHPYGDS